MSDDLVKRLRGWARDIQEGSTAIWAMDQDLKGAANRIEELEAAIESAKYFLEMHPAYSDADCRVLTKKALAELKGEDRK